MVILDKREPTAILEQKQNCASSVFVPKYLPLFLAGTDDATHEVPDSTS